MFDFSSDNGEAYIASLVPVNRRNAPLVLPATPAAKLSNGPGKGVAENYRPRAVARHANNFLPSDTASNTKVPDCAESRKHSSAGRRRLKPRKSESYS